MRLIQNLRLITKLTLAALLSTVLCTAISVLITSITLRAAARLQEEQRLDDNLKIAWHLLRENGGQIRVAGGRLMAGAQVLDGNTAFVDQLHDLAGGLVTIFHGTTRVATTITLAGGGRATGTQLAPGPVFDAVVVHHMRFSGEATILGQPYLAVYDPILSSSGEFLGMLFIGQRLGDFDAPLQTTMDRILLGAGAAMILVGIGFQPARR